MNTKFSEVRIREFFQFRGKRFCKVALSVAEDGERSGHIFSGERSKWEGGEAPRIL